MTQLINTRAFLKALRALSKSELERLCLESGMNDNEVLGILEYVYERNLAENVATKLNMSTSKFHRRKKILFNRLYNYMEYVGYKLIIFDSLFET